MGQTDMFRKATKKDCRSIYDLICDMENTALDYDEFSAIFNVNVACNGSNQFEHARTANVDSSVSILGA